ncbi:TIGR03790 family protein [Thermodesulfatator indicus]
MPKLKIWLVIFFLIISVPRVFALKTHLTPERILVVVNTKSPKSKRVAAFYQKARQIPAENMLYLPMPTREEITRPFYLKFIETPIRKFLEKKAWQDKILVILLMPDVPHKIAGKVAKNGDAASVDSELTLLYRKMLFGPYRKDGWLPNPYFQSPIDEPFEHDRYDIYLVTRIDGYTEKDSLALIKRATAAKKTHPPYTLVLDAKDGPARPGDNWLHAAYLLLKDFPGLKIEASFNRAFLVSGERVIGYASWGSNDPNYPKDRKLYFKFLPGAIGVTFVSTSARTFIEPPRHWQVNRGRKYFFQGSPQSLIGDLVRLGITGISGNAYEPYLSACARPHLLFPAYLKGKTLAEAYYRSLAYLSWQTVVLGDPLAGIGPREVERPPLENWFVKRKEAYQEAKKSKDYLLLAKIEMHLGWPEKALKYLKKLKEEKETLPPQAYSLLLAMARQKDFERRVIDFLKYDSNENAKIVEAFIYIKHKRYAWAEKVLLETPLKTPDALFLFGKVKLALKDCESAVKLIEKAIALKPNAWGFYPDLYRALKACGQKERAEKIRAKLLQMPSLAELWPELKN